MLYLTEDEVRSLLPMSDSVGLMRQTFTALAAGTAGNQPRRRLFVPTGAVLHSMAGWCGEYFGTKVYATHVKHGAHFLFWLCSSATAKPLALLEANYLGQIRTGAASGLATDLLSRPESKTLGVLGSGFQAWSQVEAMLAVRPIKEVKVFSRNEDRRTRFAIEAERVFGIFAHPAHSAQEAVRGADILVTATYARDPILDSSWVAPGTHVNAMGSNQAERREIPSDLVKRAKWIAVDSLEQAKLEAGDLLLAQPVEEWSELPLVELEQLVSIPQVARESGDITLFKSIGLGVEDVVAAAFVYRRALEQGIGREL